ncbi:MAG: glycosyltransferase family 2 protein [Pirellulaceae bacterium]
MNVDLGNVGPGSIAIELANMQLNDILARLNSVEDTLHAELREDELSIDSSFVSATKVSIVIPVFNEQATVAQVIRRVAALPLATELVLVDDASNDGTREILSRLEGVEGVRLLLKEKNEGKGAALRDGFALATGDIIVVQDADLEYDPRDIPAVVRPIVLDETDVVFGSRYIGETKQDGSLIHRFGNWLLTEASNLFTGIRLTDMETCYKAFRSEVLKDLVIRQNRFGVEPEMTAKIARRGYRIQEVPISYQARGYDEGKKIGVKDLFQAVYCIVRYGIAD